MIINYRMMLLNKQICKTIPLFCLLVLGILFQNCKAKKVLTHDNLGIFSTFAGEIDLDYLEGTYHNPIYYFEVELLKAIESNQDYYGGFWDRPEENMLVQFDRKNRQGNLINGPYKTDGHFEIDKNSFILNFKSRSVSENSISIMEIILLEENSIHILATWNNGKQEMIKYKRK